jgi:uncharacterized membrane protein
VTAISLTAAAVFAAWLVLRVLWSPTASPDSIEAEAENSTTPSSPSAPQP